MESTEKVTARELRIGNHIIIGNHHIGRVWYIDEDMDCVKVNSTSGFDYLQFKIKELTRIPLTEDWLLKFGFKKYREIDIDDAYDVFVFGSSYLPEYAEFKLNPINTLSLVKGNDGFIYKKHLLLIKYVHQLQNLYFAITGQELTVKK